MAWLFKRIKDWEGKLIKLEGNLNDKVSKEDLQKKFKKVKKKLRNETEEGDKKLNKKLIDLEKNTN